MSLGNTSRSSSCLFLHINNYTELRPYVMAMCVLNVLLCIPNIAGSALILLTMWKNPNLELASHIHLCSLAVADLITGLVVQPLFVVHKIAWLYGFWSLDCVTRVITELVAWTSAAVSCSTVGLISLDRMLAVQLHLKYQLYVTRRKTLNVTLAIWITLMFTSFSRFLMNDIEPFVIFGVVGILCGNLQVLVAYGHIYKSMKHHHRKIAGVQIQLQPSITRDNGVDSAQGLSKVIKMKALWKSAMNLAYIVGLYVSIYLPFVGSLIAFLIHGQTLPVEISYDITRTMIFCASVLNPFLYCWKIKDIKVEVYKTLTKLQGGIRNVFTARINNLESQNSSFDMHITNAAGGLRKSFTTENRLRAESVI